jgi:hypothetical protein
MNKKCAPYLFIILFFSFMNVAKAGNFSLMEKREQTVRQYVNDLGDADQAITQLFEKNAVAISTSEGKVDAQTFFKSFFPNIKYIDTQFKQFYFNKSDLNRLAARFYLTFTLKNGKKVSGNYMDEFIFAPHSEKLSAVYMFENTTSDKSLP